MTMEPLHTERAAQIARAQEAPGDELPVSNLAALLDRFTSAITNPDAESVGGFAQTVKALHGELAMLAGHFGVDAGSDAGELIDFDAIFPDGAFAAVEPGIAADEDLEHRCRELSR